MSQYLFYWLLSIIPALLFFYAISRKKPQAPESHVKTCQYCNKAMHPSEEIILLTNNKAEGTYHEDCLFLVLQFQDELTLGSES